MASNHQRYDNSAALPADGTRVEVPVTTGTVVSSVYSPTYGEDVWIVASDDQTRLISMIASSAHVVGHIEQRPKHGADRPTTNLVGWGSDRAGLERLMEGTDLNAIRRWLDNTGRLDPASVHDARPGTPTASDAGTAVRDVEISGLDGTDPHGYPTFDDTAVFLANVEELVAAANHAGLFGLRADISIGLSADTEGVMDGAYVLIDHRIGASRTVRFASFQQDAADLIDDPAATGVDAAVSILRAVARIAADVLDRATEALGSERAANSAPGE